MTPAEFKSLLKMQVHKSSLFPNQYHQKGNLKNGIAQRKAQKIWCSLVDNLRCLRLPLNWSLLTTVELAGELDSTIQANLLFDSFPVCITLIYVGDTLDILQFGSSYNTLVF